MPSEFKRLFTPLDIRGMRLRNRINMAPMVTNYATVQGHATDRLIEYYAARSRGGAGMITVEATVVSHDGRSFVHNLCIYDDAFIPGLRRLTDAVHEGGAKITTELYHAGRRTSALVARTQPIGPSGVPARGGEVPREMTRADIERVQNDFVAAARRAKAAGFDAVTVHCAHGYLINAFLSAHSNKRTDDYGGDLRARARFGLEIIERIRAEVGPDFPVLCRISGSEFIDGGLTLDDMKQVAKWYEAAGVDAIDVSVGTIETGYLTNSYMMFPRGVFVPLAEGIKEAVSIPVFAVGRINDPYFAEQVLAEGKADAVTMGRALIADPEFVNKAQAGRTAEICPCIGCNQGCTDRIGNQLDVSCLVNPQAGRELFTQLQPAETPKRVVVVGGGIAGMEAATVARERGHEVELYERSGELGGQFRLGSRAPGKDEVAHFVDYLVRRVESLGVVVHTNTELTADRVDEMRPNAVVVATGARPFTLPVPGADRAVGAWDVLLGKAQVGQKVVIIGGGQVGCETAELLAEQGREVTILEMLPELAMDMGPRAREPFLNKLVELGIDNITRATVTEIGEGEVWFDRGGLREKVSGVDTVVMAVGSRADNSLAEALRDKPYPVYTVGDCVKARRGFEAVHEAFTVASSL